MYLCVSLKIRCEHKRSELARRSARVVLSLCGLAENESDSARPISSICGNLNSRLSARAFWTELAHMCSP